MTKCRRSMGAVVIVAAMRVPLAAADATVVESPPVARADLSGVWRARTGDNPGWAEPSFDDSLWRRVTLPGKWAEEGFTGVEGPIWYRREVPLGKPLTAGTADGWGILIGRTRFGSVSVWVNGHPVGQVGGPGLTFPVPALRVMAIPSAAVEGSDRLVVAIRVSRVAWASDRARFGGPVGDDLVLAPFRELLVRAEGDRRGELMATMPMLMGALVLLLAALYFLYLWGRWRFGTEYLWFGLSSLSLAGNTLLNTPWIYELTDRFPLVYRLTAISGLLTPALFMEFLWTFLRRPMGRLLRAYQGSFGLIALAITVTPRLGWVVDTEGLRWFWLLPLLIWGLITVVVEARRGNEAARSVVLAGVLLAAAELTAIVAHFAGWVPPLGLEPSMAFCVFLVAMGVVLGDRLNRMRTKLDALFGDLTESEARFRGFVENAQIGIYRTTPAGRITMANPKSASIFGFASPEELMQENLEEWALQGWLDRERFRVLMERAGAVTGLESEVTRPDGKVIVIREHVRAIRDENGAIRFYEGTIEDLTEHKALEAQLRHSQKMEAVGSLAGGVAHDFNNLLQAMLSHTQILHHSSEDPEAVRRVARELEQQVQRGAALTRQLLVFSRRETIKPERLDLNEAVQETMQILQRLVRENIALTIELAPGFLPVRGDRGQLQQILMNLAVNASDAMPSGGTLVIRTGAGEHEKVVLTVEDTGHGIPEGIRDRIFEPFFTTKAADRGTGLGLSVVHGIVTQHGGCVEVESTVGRGSTFRVILPLAGPAGEAGAPSPPSCDAMPGAGERVLLVEDEAAAREGLQEILKSLGYDVVAVASGEDAERLPADRPFDVLLTDVMLPGVAGPQLAQTLKERWPGLKVILMSGYAKDEAVRRGASEGEVRFLQKPFSMATLAGELRAALDEACPAKALTASASGVESAVMSQKVSIARRAQRKSR